MKLLLAVALVAAALVSAGPQNLETPKNPEAPTGFDNKSNGMVDDATHQADQVKFDEVEAVDDGLGPLYNAQSCRECHQNPTSGGTSQITELRVGHQGPDHRFRNPDIPIAHGTEIISGRTLVNDRSICPSAAFPNQEIQEHVPDSENIRTTRASLGLLGDGFVEAVADQTLVELSRKQCRETKNKICGQAIHVPIVEAPGQTGVARFGWKDQHASLLSFSGDAYLNEMGITSHLFPDEVTKLCNTAPEPNNSPGPDGLDDVDHFAQHTYLRDTLKTPLLVVARYVPAPTGERLVQAGINFVDAVGNVHLDLGRNYHAFVLGRKEPKPKLGERRTTAALVQVTFVLLVDETVINEPVRKLAEVAGIGKTAAAEARQRLIEAAMLRTTRQGLRITNRKALEQDFLAGYERVLRPDLLIGTFRPLERDPDLLLDNFKGWADRNELVWAVTGGPAAFALDRFYRGERITVFVNNASEHMNRELKLLPDTNGPMTLLRAFGTLIPWRTQDDLPIAQPLLIYAELLHQGDPRELEAAAHIREKYLTQ